MPPGSGSSMMQPHKYGVAHVAFHPISPQYIVTIGVQHDGLIHLWDWKKNVRLASAKVTSKVIFLTLLSAKKTTKKRFTYIASLDLVGELF